MILLIDAAATLLLLITAINENYHESLKSSVLGIKCKIKPILAIFKCN